MTPMASPGPLRFVTDPWTYLNYIALEWGCLEDLKGWLVCLAVLVVTGVRSGITYSFGMFVVKLKEAFPEMTMAEQSWIGTLSFCISLSCAPVSVGFIRMFGHKGFRFSGLLGTGVLTLSCIASSFVRTPEWLFMTYSFMYGIGSSLIYMASSLVIGDHFPAEHKYHVLATSILLCGYPIGSLLFNPINAWVLDEYDFRVAFRCAGGMVLVTGIICCWNFSARQDATCSQLEGAAGGGGAERFDAESDYDDDDGVRSTGSGPMSSATVTRYCTLADIRRRPEIVLWNIGNLLSYLGFYMPFVNLGYYMELKHFDLQKSSIALTLLSMAECVTYVVASFLGDYLKDRLVYVNVVSSFCLAIICIIWPLIDITFVMILAVAIGMGGFLGLNIVYTYAASGEVTQLPIDVAWACTNLWSGFGILLGPFFSGAIYDIKKSYTDVFLINGAVYIVATVVFGAIPVLQWMRDGPPGGSDEMNGATRFETFRISTKRSTSRGSIANGVDGLPPAAPPSAAAATVAAESMMSAYGTMSSAGPGAEMGSAGYGYGYGAGGGQDWDGMRSGSGQMGAGYVYGSLQ